jgi:hypothetical protein
VNVLWRVNSVKLLGVLLTSWLILAGCSGSSKSATATPMSAAEMPAYGARASMAVADERTAMAPPSPDAPVAAHDVPAPVPGTPPPDSPVRKIAPLLIYTAEFQMAVFEAKQAIDNLEGMAQELGGYLVSRDDHTLIVRVPAEKYREALKKVAAAGDVLHRAERVEDVTDQFFDLEARARNARALRNRLEELLKQAKDVKEAILVEHELARTTGEIEALEGKLKRLRELIAFSTITVRFQAKRTEHVEPKVKLPFPWLDRLGLPHLRSL